MNNGFNMKRILHQLYNDISIKIIYFGIAIMSLVYVFNILISHQIISEKTSILTWLVTSVLLLFCIKSMIKLFSLFNRTYNKIEEKLINWVLDWVFNIHNM